MFKKILTTLLAASMLCSFGVGCKKKNDGNVITWVMPGPANQQDAEKVWSEFNKQLRTYEGFEDITVNFEVYDASEYSQKFLTKQINGDSMDIIQTYTLDFVKESRNGTFAPLNEYLDDEMKETKEELPEFIFKYGEVDGKIYGVTNYQMCPNMYALNINKELADKYLNIPKIKELLSKPEFDTALFDELEPLLANAKQNGELDKGFNPLFSYMFASRLYDDLGKMFCIKTYGDSTEVKLFFESEENKAVYDKMHEWYEKGYIRKDVLSVDDLKKDNDKEGGHIMWIANNFKGEEVVTGPESGIESYVLYLSPNPVVPVSNAAGALAISAGSQNKEKAAKLINLMNCEKGKDLYNLLVWGLEGEHYNKVSDDKIETLGYTGQGTSSSPYGLWKWVVGNTKYAYDTQVDAENYKTFVFEEFNEGENTVVSRAIGFKADLTKYESNIQQISSIDSEYTKPLMYGAVEDYENVYKEFMNKLKACKSDEISKEIQKQLEKYLSAE